MVILVAVAIVALGLYTATLPEVQVLARRGATYTLASSGGLYFNFTVDGEGGHLVGSYASTNATWTWIHPLSTWGVIPRGPAEGTCQGRLDSILPPGAYVITFFGGPATVITTETFQVTPARAPEGASGFASGYGPPCPSPP